MKMVVGSCLLFVGCSIGAVGCRPCVSLPAGETEVVIAPTAQPSVRFAAQEMTNFLSRVFVRVVPIVTTPTAGKAHIILGTNGWSEAAGVRIEGLKTDGYVIQAKGSDVFIAGTDNPTFDPYNSLARPSWGSNDSDHGTMNGVYGFLEDCADVRLYFPGEMGECVKPLGVVRVPEGRHVFEPELSTRTWSLYSDGAWFEGDKPDQLCHPKKALNLFRLRESTKEYGCCHGLNGFHYVERFGKTHPEYFALDANGKRMIEGTGWTRGHLCFSSGIREEIYKDCLSYCKGEDASVRGIIGPYANHSWGKKFEWNYNVKPNYIDLMPQDGGAMCHCDKCKAAMRKDGRKCPMTEIVWGLLAEVAARLKTQGYEPTFTMMSYADYSDLPDCPLPENLRVMIAKTGPWANTRPDNVSGDDEYFAKWEKRTGNKPWIWTYPRRGESLNQPEVPSWAPRAWAKYYQGVSEHIFGYFAECETTRGIDNLMCYYMLSKIGWNRRVDTNAILEEFYVRMFGKAASDMKQALEFIEDKFTLNVAGNLKMTDIGPISDVPDDYRLWTQIYSAAEMARLAGYFDAAAAKVVPDGIEARRIALFRTWMYEPLARRGAEYRKSIDVPSGLAYYKAHADKNLLGEKWWIQSGGRCKDVKLVLNESSRLCTSEKDTSCWTANWVKKDAVIEPGATYRLSWFVKVNLEAKQSGGGAAMAFNVETPDKKWNKSWWFPVTGNYFAGQHDWIHQFVEFTIPADAPKGITGGAGPFLRYCLGEAWYDGLLLERIK